MVDMGARGDCSRAAGERPRRRITAEKQRSQRKAGRLTQRGRRKPENREGIRREADSKATARFRGEGKDARLRGKSRRPLHKSKAKEPALRTATTKTPAGRLLDGRWKFECSVGD